MKRCLLLLLLGCGHATTAPKSQPLVRDTLSHWSDTATYPPIPHH